MTEADTSAGPGPRGTLEVGDPESPFLPQGQLATRLESSAAGAAAEEQSRTAGRMPVPVPSAVLSALSRGLPEFAIQMAIKAGYRDEGELTDIIFFFRHPNLAGRRIQPHEHQFAREWVTIRNSIVRPALRSAQPAPTAPSGPPEPQAGPPEPQAPPEDLSADRLEWSGHSAAELAFMRAVYELHRHLSHGDFVGNLPPGELALIEEGHSARTDAAAAARELLRDARDALAKTNPGVRIGITSAYRSASRQFRIWQGSDPHGKSKGSGFPYYYRRAMEKRFVAAGDYSPAAVRAVTRYLRGYIASPGYSNHQDGLAIDFGTSASARDRLGRIGSRAAFHRWLVENAARYHFHPLATEPWHWVYRPPASAAESADFGEELEAAVLEAASHDGLDLEAEFWEEEFREEGIEADAHEGGEAGFWDEGDEPDSDEAEGREAGFWGEASESLSAEEDADELDELLEFSEPGNEWVEVAGEAAVACTFPSGTRLRVIPVPDGPGEEHYDPHGTGNPVYDTGPAVRATRLSRNFTVGELARSGGRASNEARISCDLVRLLQRLRDRVNRPVVVTSGYRSFADNARVYRARNQTPTRSRHSSGEAADVKVRGMTGMEIAKAAIDVWGPDLGVGIGASYAHVDVRPAWKRWTYLPGHQSAAAVAEIDAYRQARLAARPAPAPSPAGPAPSPAGPASSPAGPAAQVRIVSGSYGDWRGLSHRTTLRYRFGEDWKDRVLAAVSKVESGFDGVNAYDRGILSWGISQWTAHAGSLLKALREVKRRVGGRRFDELFDGLDVTSGKPGGFVFQGKLYVTRDEISRLFRGSADPGSFDDARLRHWVTVFALAGQDQAVQEAQRALARHEFDQSMEESVGTRLFFIRDRCDRTSKPTRQQRFWCQRLPQSAQAYQDAYTRVRDYVRDDLTAATLYYGMRVNNPTWALLEFKKAIDKTAPANSWPLRGDQWPSGAQVTFSRKLEQVFWDSAIGNWGDKKASAKGRKSRTERLLGRRVAQSGGGREWELAVPGEDDPRQPGVLDVSVDADLRPAGEPDDEVFDGETWESFSPEPAPWADEVFAEEADDRDD